MLRFSRQVSILAGAGLLWLSCGEAKADPKPVVSAKVPERAVGARFGFDPTWIVGLNYARGWRHVIGEHDARLDVQVDAPVTLIPTGLNWRAMMGLTGLFHVREPFQIALQGGMGAATSRSVLGTKLAWIFDVAFRPGVYGKRGHFAGDVNYRVALATRVWHSDVVAATFDDRYPEGSNASLAEKGPLDGRYGFRSQRIRLGFTTGFQAGGLFALYGGAGFQYTPQPPGILMNAPLGVFPFYANLGIDFRWPR